jgi:hypothetical protein
LARRRRDFAHAIGSVPAESPGSNTHPTAAVFANIAVPCKSHGKFHTPPKSRIPMLYTAFCDAQHQISPTQPREDPSNIRDAYVLQSVPDVRPQAWGRAPTVSSLMRNADPEHRSDPPDTHDAVRRGEIAPVRRAQAFMPSPTALNWVIAIGLISLGYAIYLRYLVIEQTSVGLACDGGLKTWLCLTRKVVTGLFENEVFGWVGLGAAVLALIRPSLPLFIIGLAASAFGLVLHNGALAGLAAALLIMCFARPVAETE